MSRIHVLVSQPRLALGALLTLLLAAGAVVGSGADFTASSANPANTFASGTRRIDELQRGRRDHDGREHAPGRRRRRSARRHREQRLARAARSRSPAPPRRTPTPATRCRQKLNVDRRRLRPFGRRHRPGCGDGDDVTLYTGTLAEMGTAGHAIVRSATTPPATSTVPLHRRARRLGRRTPTRATRRPSEFNFNAASSQTDAADHGSIRRWRATPPRPQQRRTHRVRRGARRGHARRAARARPRARSAGSATRSSPAR